MDKTVALHVQLAPRGHALQRRVKGTILGKRLDVGYEVGPRRRSSMSDLGVTH